MASFWVFDNFPIHVVQHTEHLRGHRPIAQAETKCRMNETVRFHDRYLAAHEQPLGNMRLRCTSVATDIAHDCRIKLGITIAHFLVHDPGSGPHR